ncbi:MAG TPA: hypothetical protein VK279_09510 [Solirubrobacteraceae bacterium]|nr:hypothetical protein [Solirubrobacteraceae bacterium]
MTSARSRAYGRVIKTLSDLAGAKLHPGESDVVREAADALLFCEDLGADDDAARALQSTRELLVQLVDSGRLMPETAERLLDDVEACGPLSSALSR